MTSLPKAASSQTLILTLDLAGTAVFALEGAGAGAESRLDLLGVLVIAFVTALGGGITRDLLIGATPPRAFADWRYPVVAFAAGIAAFLLSEWVRVFPSGLLIVLDAAGLTLFAIAGAEKALEAGLGAVPAILIAGVTAVGGGVIRDMLLQTVPAVLTRDIYATAALTGAAIMVAGRRLGLSNAYAATLGAVCCFALRMTAVHFGWQLPRAG